MHEKLVTKMEMYQKKAVKDALSNVLIYSNLKM